MDKQQQFTEGANAIEEKHRDFFDNHPHNEDGIKQTIHHHCLFLFDNSGVRFAVTDEHLLPDGVKQDLLNLFHEVYSQSD